VDSGLSWIFRREARPPIRGFEPKLRRKPSLRKSKLKPLNRKRSHKQGRNKRRRRRQKYRPIRPNPKIRPSKPSHLAKHRPPPSHPASRKPRRLHLLPRQFPRQHKAKRARLKTPHHRAGTRHRRSQLKVSQFRGNPIPLAYHRVCRLRCRLLWGRGQPRFRRHLGCRHLGCRLWAGKSWSERLCRFRSGSMSSLFRCKGRFSQPLARKRESMGRACRRLCPRLLIVCLWRVRFLVLFLFLFLLV